MEMMENDPTKINDDPNDRLRENDADLQIEATIFKQGQDYAERNARSKEENKGRAEGRAKIKNLGMDTNAYATAIRLIKDKTQSEIAAWRRDFDLTMKVMGSKQKELFPDEQLKAEARIQRAKDKAAGKPRTAAELDAKTDTDPNSDPKNGGAQVDLEQAIAEQTARELAEGATLLEGKSDAWRVGHAAFGNGDLNPHDLGSQAALDWKIGWDAANDAAFEAAKPPEGGQPSPSTPPEGSTPTEKPRKQSQSAKAAAIAAAVQGKMN